MDNWEQALAALRIAGGSKAVPIDERELRSRLAESAALAGPPRFTTEDLAARVRRLRRRRRNRAGIITAVSAAVASAVAIPLTLGGTSQPVIGQPPPPPPGLSDTVTVNGQPRAVPAAGAVPLFTVTPGEGLTITVEVAVPGPRAMTALWLGITNGMLSGHATMEPVLAASTRVPLPSGATSPAAVARRLRTKALHAVTICDGIRPAWIRAVRTTFGKAMTAVGGGNDIAGHATGAVYLVLMKGDFAFRESGPVLPSCAHAGPAGHYFTAVFDAATFVTLEAGLANRPPPVPLQTLGPALNLG